jgi:hypothetical protein
MRNTSPATTAALATSRPGLKSTSATRGSDVANALRCMLAAVTSNGVEASAGVPSARHALVISWRPGPVPPGTDSPLRRTSPATPGRAEPMRVPSRKK